jgi:mannosylglycerate hydrolase
VPCPPLDGNDLTFVQEGSQVDRGDDPALRRVRFRRANDPRRVPKSAGVLYYGSRLSETLGLPHVRREDRQKHDNRIEDQEMDKVIVVPHTHWDREWYLPFERYRYFLVRMVDGLLEILDREADYIHFLLDGQTVLIEDYLQIRPENEGRLKEAIVKGRVGTGPWYTMPDEFLVGGEAIVRNLMLGHQIGNELGGAMKVGYLPDPFGHISQMPQILRGFGIEFACMMRGVDWPQAEFYWEAPDGSRVLTHWFSLGYANGLYISEDRETFHYYRFVDLQSALDFLADKASAGVVLLMCGNDHLRAQPGIPKTIKKLNRTMDGKWLQGSLIDFFTLVKEKNPRLLVHKGEMRNARYSPILPGVLSSRMYLKQRNDRLQKLLVGYAEPITSLAWALGENTPRGFLKQAWKRLLQNHFHDSICASSIDQVHREMMIRFDRVEQIAESLIGDYLVRLGRRVTGEGEGTAILVFNPTPRKRNGKIDLWVDAQENVMGEEGQNPGGFTLLDPEGKQVPCRVVEKGMFPGDILRGEAHTEKVRISFLAEEIPPCGYKIYKLPCSGGEAAERCGLSDGKRALENEYYRVAIQSNGTLDVVDKTSGFIYRGLGFFEDSGDSGDEYNYNPPPNQEVFDTRGMEAEITLLEDGPDWGTIRSRLLFELPQELSSDRKGRSGRCVVCEIVSDVTLLRGVQSIHVRTTVDNRARDHRLRVVFLTGLPTSEAIAQTAFAAIERSTELPDGVDWVERPSPTQPTAGFVAVQGSGAGLAVVGKGLPEYEVMPKGGIHLTLLRCIGWLSREDLKTRPGHAGPPYETPEAQCIGKQTFEYALIPFKGEWVDGGAFLEAQLFALPPMAVQLKERVAIKGAGSFLSIEPQEMVLSAIKKAEREEAVVIRLFNISRKLVEGKVKVHFEVKEACEADLNEARQGSLELVDSEIPFLARGGEIKTIMLYP